MFYFRINKIINCRDKGVVRIVRRRMEVVGLGGWGELRDGRRSGWFRLEGFMIRVCYKGV